MAEREQLLLELKQLLRRKGLNYKDAAGALGLSEISIKRIFSNKDVSLSRLEKLCEFAETDLIELVQLSENRLDRVDQLSVEQEREIIEDPRLLVVALYLLDRSSAETIRNLYHFTEPEMVGMLVKLDKIGVIDLLPENRYRLRISRKFRWQRNGPLQRFFTEQVLAEYLSKGLRESDNQFRFIWGMMTPESAGEFSRKLNRLIEEYAQIAEHDLRVSPEHKSLTSLMVLFKERWTTDLFARIVQESNKGADGAEKNN
jgi:DNA-binding Xre family transcriptional regulator